MAAAASYTPPLLRDRAVCVSLRSPSLLLRLRCLSRSVAAEDVAVLRTVQCAWRPAESSKHDSKHGRRIHEQKNSKVSNG